MRLSSIRPDDIVLADVRGMRFYARVRDHADRGLVLGELDFTDRSIPYRTVTARQVKAHYSKRKG